MNCPTCNKDMESGTVYLRASVFGFMFRGTSHQPLRFMPDHSMEEYTVLQKKFLPGGDVKPAHRCKSCGTVVFQGEI
jgi:hypothetical protein